VVILDQNKRKSEEKIYKENKLIVERKTAIEKGRGKHGGNKSTVVIQRPLYACSVHNGTTKAVIVWWHCSEIFNDKQTGRLAL
jgi:hypothetical protein